jgi:ABC-type nickel/cobalt efflux system permease component RcnA
LIGAGLFHERLERLLGLTGPHRHLFFTHAHETRGEPGSGPITWRRLAGLGLSGGIVPCPSAIVVLLSAVALHRVAFGLLLIVAFSVGLASVLIAVGLLFVYATRLVARLGEGGMVARVLPVVSALVVTAFGLVISVESLRGTGLLRFPG